MIRVLVVDDSAFMRRAIRRLLESAPDIQVVGAARDGAEGVQMACELRPDVVTLDVEMPVLDGLQALAKIMATSPRPVVMVSSLTRAHAETTIQALVAGAVDFVAKPSGTVSLDIERVADELVAKVRAAGSAPVARRAPLRPAAPCLPRREDRGLLVVGCSTGGPQALRLLMPALPGDLPLPVLVVQHMPPGFTRALAARLDGEAALTVQEAQHGDRLLPGRVLVAPGGRHLVVHADGRVTLDDGPPQHGVRPSVDVTLESAAASFGARTVAVILTGMGMDGARGAGLVRRAGGRVLAEAQESCVVYGMPRAVVEMGYADQVLALEQMPEAITAAAGRVGVAMR